MKLNGKIVTLRAIESYDLEFIREMVNDTWMEYHIAGWSFPLSKKDQEEWYASFHNSDKAIRFIIETEKDGVVGLTGLKNIDWKNAVADGGGMRIAKRDNMSKGLATDAYMTLLYYAFYELRLNRINGSVLPYNVASRKVTEKVGFREEGIQRKAVFKKGEYQDIILLGILKEDYDKILKETLYWNKD
jgi:RimJ/RimL family protein N-acetyltransferase